MNQINSFCGKRRISINENKSFELIFRKHSRKSTAEVNAKPILFHNTPIPFKSSGRFLGIAFDQQLSFKNHITQIKSKAKHGSMRLNTLHSTKYCPSNTTMIRLFKIFVRPLLEYGHIATVTTKPHLIKHWETVQTTYIRQILRLPRLHNNYTRKLANLPTIQDRLYQLSDKWYQKTLKNNKEMKKFIEAVAQKGSRLKTPYTIINKMT